MCLGPQKDKVHAIVEAYYGGQSGADAIAAVLFGSYNPSGKLPVTMYPPEYMQQNPITEMSVSAPPGRTHMYYTGPTEFPFGWGLSYSEWELVMVKADELLAVPSQANFKIRLANKGPAAGQQRVLAFLRLSPNLSDSSPQQKLWDYQAVALAAGESNELSFVLTPEALAVSDLHGNRVVHPGLYTVVFSYGDGSELTAKISITGGPVILDETVFSET